MNSRRFSMRRGMLPNVRGGVKEFVEASDCRSANLAIIESLQSDHLT
jgi:hypothetical protein